MPISQKRAYIIGAVVVVLLQVIVAPNIGILNAAPNFILCYLVACSVANPREMGFIAPFILGLVYNLAGQGPLGSMALVCILAVLFASSVLRALELESILFPIITIAVVCFLAEFVYGLLLMACGMSVNFLDALLQICLPCGLYDAIIAIIAYPFLRRFMFSAKKQSEMSIIDSTID